MTVQFQHSPNLLTRKPILNNWTVSAWVCLSVFALDVNADRLFHDSSFLSMAFPWMGATSLVLSIEMRVIGWNSDFHSYPSWCWSAMVCSRLLSCSSIYQDAIQLARGCGCVGRWFSGILWQQQKKLGSHVRKIRFTLACTASVNPAFCWVETSPVAYLRGPRKKWTFSGRRVLPLYAEVLVPDPSGKGKCSVMCLSKRQRNNEDATQIESH